MNALAFFYLFWAGLSLWVLLDVHRLAPYLLPWAWSSKPGRIQRALVRAAAVINLLGAVRMLMRTLR